MFTELTTTGHNLFEVFLPVGVQELISFINNREPSILSVFQNGNCKLASV
jgi:hypothetical protein